MMMPSNKSKSNDRSKSTKRRNNHVKCMFPSSRRLRMRSPRLISSYDSAETSSSSCGSNSNSNNNKEVVVDEGTAAANDLVLEDCCYYDTDESFSLRRRPPKMKPRRYRSKNTTATTAVMTMTMTMTATATATATATVVSTITDKDVLLGRGGGTNHWIGNTTFRSLVHAQKRCYDDTALGQKYLVAAQLVKDWNASGGQFLERIDPQVGAGSVVQHEGDWQVVSEDRAFKKTFQCLRSKQGTALGVPTATVGHADLLLATARGAVVSSPTPIQFVPTRTNSTAENAVLLFADDEHHHVRQDTVPGRLVCSSQLPSRTAAALFIPIVEEDRSSPGAPVRIQSSSTSSSSAWSFPTTPSAILCPLPPPKRQHLACHDHKYHDHSNRQSKKNNRLTQQDYHAAAVLQSWNEEAHEAAFILRMTKLSPMKSDEIRAFRVVSPETTTTAMIATASGEDYTTPATTTTTTTTIGTRTDNNSKTIEADDLTPPTPLRAEDSNHHAMMAWLLNQRPRLSLVQDSPSVDDEAPASSSMRFDVGASSIPVLKEKGNDNDDDDDLIQALLPIKKRHVFHW